MMTTPCCWQPDVAAARSRHSRTDPAARHCHPTRARDALIGTQAATVVAQLKPDSYFNFVELMFERQEQFHHAAGRDKTPTSMEELFASWAKETCGIEKEKFLETYESDDNYLWTKESHRAGILKGVWSTPTFAINGIEADKLGSSSSPDEWAALLDPMLDVDTSGGAAGAGSGTA